MIRLLFACSLLTAAVYLAITHVNPQGRGGPVGKLMAVATPPSPTPGATPTPKPNGQGSVGGLFDVDMDQGFIHCIMRLDEDSVTHQVEGAAQCYAQLDFSSPGQEPPCAVIYSTGGSPTPIVPGEGACSDSGGSSPPPPPPYTSHSPVKFVGLHDVNTDELLLTGCFADVGSGSGPGVIMIFAVPGASQTIGGSVGSVATTIMNIWTGQSDANCDAGTPIGYYPLVTVATLTKVTTTRDYDGDGCMDKSELWAGKPGGSTICGNDPYNPYDSPAGTTPDISGSYDILMEKTRADACASGLPSPDCTGKADRTIVPGYYFECKSDIQQSGTPAPGNNLTAPILCYIDSPSVTVNPQTAAYSGTPIYTCAIPPATPQLGVTADPKYCGDGLPGASPPGCNQVSAGTNLCVALAPNCPTVPCDVSQYQFADIDSQQAQLTGTLDNTTHIMSLFGCFQDLDGFGQLGNVYVRAKIDAYTGIGIGNVYANETSANCTGNIPATAPTFVRISAVRQAPGSKNNCSETTAPLCRDSDGDGCPDKRELGNVRALGGLRDPMNRFDYPDIPNSSTASKDHKIRINDVSYVVQRYHHDQGGTAPPLYNSLADHSALGSNPSNLGPGDGQIRINDVSAVVQQYHNDCV